MDEIDQWAIAQIARISRQVEAEANRRKSDRRRLDRLAGEKRSFIRLRSYIHGARTADRLAARMGATFVPFDTEENRHGRQN